MAHRIYVYNIDTDTKEMFPFELAEWNYNIPPLMVLLFSHNIRSKGVYLYANKEEGILNLRRFYDLLGEIYQLQYKKVFHEPVNHMFSFLENLPYDTFKIDATDVFNMNEDKHSQQAKEWVLEIKEQTEWFEQAIREQNLAPLQSFLETFFYSSFLQVLQTDWINYGLGYWNDEAFKNDYVLYFKEGNLHGFTDAKGNILAPAIYQDIYQFVDNVAAVTKDNKSGYINTKGKIIIPLQYDEAYDVFTIYYGEQVDYKFQHETNVAIVGQDNRYGLTVIPDHELIIPIEYDELEWLIHNLFNAKKGDNYYLINHRNELLISSLSDSPFRYENHFLLFTKLQGSSKCKIFNLDGVYLGDYNPKKIEELPHRHYYVGPSKWQGKAALLKPDGALLQTEVDRVLKEGNYDTIAYQKNKIWHFFNLLEQKEIVLDADVIKIVDSKIRCFIKNTYLLQTAQGLGLFDAMRNIWLVSACSDSRNRSYQREFSSGKDERKLSLL